MSNLTQVILPHLAALRLLISDILSFGRVGEQIGEVIQRKATFRVSQAITRMILDGAIGDEPTYGDLKYLSMETLRHSLSDNGVVGIPISRIQMLVSAFQAVAALGHNAPVCSDPACGRFPLIQQEDRSFAFQQSTTTGKMTGTVCPTCGTLIQGMTVRTHEIAWPTNRPVLFGTRFDTVSMTGVALPLQDADIPPYLAEYFYGEINHTIRSILEQVGCPVSKFLRYLRHYSEIKGTLGTPHDLLGRLIEPKLPIQTLEVFATRAKDLSDEVEEKPTEDKSKGSPTATSKTSISAEDRKTCTKILNDHDLRLLVADLSLDSEQLTDGVTKEVKFLEICQLVDRHGKLQPLVEWMIDRAPVLKETLAKYLPVVYLVARLSRYQMKSLREVSSSVITNPEVIDNIRKDAGIPSGRVDLSGSAEMIWSRLFDEAYRQGIEMMNAVLSEAAHRAPTLDVEFRRIGQMR